MFTNVPVRKFQNIVFEPFSHSHILQVILCKKQVEIKYKYVKDFFRKIYSFLRYICPVLEFLNLLVI